MKLPVIFALLTGLFWGLYGPAIGEARSGLGSPFKPYVAIGVAYLIWGILGGLVGMGYRGDDFSVGSFTGPGGIWGLIGGSLGAWGALTLTLAMFNGGKPHTVMPIVFGTAVVVTAIVGVAMTRQTGNIWLWVGILGMAVCIVLVASNTPHAGPKSPGQPAAHGSETTTTPTAS